jgi:hypothetical protein
MAFSDMRSAALAIQFSTTQGFAENVTYDSGSPIPAIVDYAQAPDDEPGTTVEYAEIIVRKSDVALPEYRDPVVIGSTTWLVRRIAVGDDETWTLTLFKAEGPQL